MFVSSLVSFASLCGKLIVFSRKQSLIGRGINFNLDFIHQFSRISEEESRFSLCLQKPEVLDPATTDEKAIASPWHRQVRLNRA